MYRSVNSLDAALCNGRERFQAKSNSVYSEPLLRFDRVGISSTLMCLTDKTRKRKKQGKETKAKVPKSKGYGQHLLDSNASIDICLWSSSPNHHLDTGGGLGVSGAFLTIFILSAILRWRSGRSCLSFLICALAVSVDSGLALCNARFASCPFLAPC